MRFDVLLRPGVAALAMLFVLPAFAEEWLLYTILDGKILILRTDIMNIRLVPSKWPT